MILAPFWALWCQFSTFRAKVGPALTNSRSKTSLLSLTNDMHECNFGPMQVMYHDVCMCNLLWLKHHKLSRVSPHSTSPRWALSWWSTISPTVVCSSELRSADHCIEESAVTPSAYNLLTCTSTESYRCWNPLRLWWELTAVKFNNASMCLFTINWLLPNFLFSMAAASLWIAEVKVSLAMDSAAVDSKKVFKKLNYHHLIGSDYCG